MSTESNRGESWTDRSGQWFQSPSGVFRRKTENINVNTFWSSLQIFRLNLNVPNLDQESERPEIKLSKKQICLLKMLDLKNYPLPLNWLEFQIVP